MTEKETKFPYVSEERLKEVFDFFEDFEIPSSDPYQLSPQLEKASLLREEGFSFSSSSSSTSPSIVPTTPANQR